MDLVWNRCKSGASGRHLLGEHDPALQTRSEPVQVVAPLAECQIQRDDLAEKPLGTWVIDRIDRMQKIDMMSGSMRQAPDRIVEVSVAQLEHEGRMNRQPKQW